MAKSRKKGRSSKSRGKRSARTFVGHPSYAGAKYDCYGKRVKSGRSKSKHPRVFCGKAA